MDKTEQHKDKTFKMRKMVVWRVYNLQKRRHESCCRNVYMQSRTIQRYRQTPAGPRLSKRIKMARRIGHSLLRQDGPEQPNSGPWCPEGVYISWLAPKRGQRFRNNIASSLTHHL